MKRAILLLMCVVLACPAWAIPLEKVQLELCPFGLPLGTSDANDLVVRDIYALSANPTTKFADWVVYRLDPCTVRGPKITDRDWKADALLHPDVTLEEKDYEDVGKLTSYQRGHQAPLAGFKGTKSWDKSNYLSNITPQTDDLNTGAWEKLEAAERQLALGNEVFVMTGTVYEREMPGLPQADEPHKVPSGYWKIIVTGYPSKLKAVGFFFDQNTPKRPLAKSDAVAIRQIEAKTGLHFFWKYPPNVEAKLSGSIDQELLGQLVPSK